MNWVWRITLSKSSYKGREITSEVYNGVTGNIFTPNIGSSQGDCASPIWFIFYLHKAILAAKVNFETSRNILLDIKHDHTYVNKDSFKSDIEKDNSYSKSITSKGNCGFLMEPTTVGSLWLENDLHENELEFESHMGRSKKNV